MSHISLCAVALVLMLISAAGWVTHVVWTFQQEMVSTVLLGIIGILVGPIGAIHGITLWF